ncbi:dicarboxylic amino acid permease [Phyllosticta capitalensis]
MEATRRFLFSRSSAASLRQVRLPSSSTTGTSQSSGANEKRAAAAAGTAPPALERKLKPRHVQMMSVAGAFGTGLIISSGTGLMRGGPGSLLIAYVIMGFTVFSVMTALAEMATFATSDRGFPGYATRFADPALGFATGYNYFLKYIVVLANNLTASGIILQYWLPHLNVGIWITVFAPPVILINLFHVRVFGETQYVSGVLKLLVMAMLIISCLVASLLSVPSRGGRIGFRYWRDPGPFASYFHSVAGHDEEGSWGRALGLWACIIQASFAYLGTEVVGMAFGETPNVEKEVPKAIQWTFWRIIVFYIGGAVVLGMNVPYTNEMLMASTGRNAAASPFVIAMRLARIPVLPDVVNACLLIFVLSAACSDIYVASRTLYALSRDSLAPAIFSRTIAPDASSHAPSSLRARIAHLAHGVPIPAVLLSSVFALLAYLNTAAGTSTIFARFVSLVTIFGLLNWIAILITYLSFRAGLRAQRVPRSALPYQGFGQPYLAMAALAVTLCVVLGAGFEAFVPRWDAGAFVTGYLGIVLFVCMFVGAKLLMKTAWVRGSSMDLTSGTAWGRSLEGDEVMWREVPPVTQTAALEHWESRHTENIDEV